MTRFAFALASESARLPGPEEDLQLRCEIASVLHFQLKGPVSAVPAPSCVDERSSCESKTFNWGALAPLCKLCAAAVLDRKRKFGNLYRV